jgi:uncharacterized protein
MTTPAEAVSSTPRYEIARPVMTQSWVGLTFLHWPCDPAAVAPLLPRGVEPDVMGGSSWVGLVPFAMRRVRLLGARLPTVSDFLETNVRVYGVDAQGRRSVVFLSLDADRLAPVAGARATYRLPYFWSSMTMRQEGDVVTYTTRRRLSGARSLVRVRVGAAAAADPLDDFLTARWGLHSRWYGGTAFAPVAHERWPLRTAELLELDDGLVVAAGLPAPVGPPRVLHSAQVDVRIGRPVLHRRS